jgi:alpha-aminoadipic semialdehyde synthase
LAKIRGIFMGVIIGIRREDKNIWERRTPLIPQHIKELISKHHIQFILQPSKIRAFPDEEYVKAGAKINDDLSLCDIILAIKEIPVDFFQNNKTYMFFSHTIKGQARNMPMLKKIMQKGCQLIDYEKVVDESGRRLIFFGIHAGYAGMIDTLWAFGQRLKWEGIDSPFSRIKQAIHYKDLEDAKRAIFEVGKKIEIDGLDPSITPLICGITGYGNVSTGVQEILSFLPAKQIKPAEILSLYESKQFSRHHIYKVVFKEEDMVEPISPDYRFQLQDYYDNPHKYRSQFHKYVPYLTILVNAIYWDKRYPRFVTKKLLKEIFTEEQKPRLKIIGDISCDVEGSIECTTHCTTPGEPVFVYNPLDEKTKNGVEGKGVVVLAVDNLPCELPRESSTYFSQALLPFIPEIVKADYSVDFDKCSLPAPIKKAVIVYHGKLTPNYTYLEKYLI